MYMQWKLFDQIPETGDIPYAELAQTIGGSEELVCKSTPSTLAGNHIIVKLVLC